MSRKRRIHWGRYFFEFLSIFIGVSLAFAMNKWNEDRRDAQSASKILIEIKNGLEQDKEDMKANIRGHNIGIKANTITKQWVIGQNPIPDSLSIFYKKILLRDFISIQNNSAYESLKSKGLELIGNDSLRMKIIELYDFYYEILDKIEEHYAENQYHNSYFHKINDIVAPYLVYDSEGNFSNVKPLSAISRVEKNKLFMYLEKIKYNREFTIVQYNSVVLKIDSLITHIDQELHN